MKKRTDKIGLPDRFPETLLILGTDLAGKDHFANVLTDTAVAAGVKVERRRGALSARPDQRRTSEGKGIFKLWLEWLFLATLPLFRRLLPYGTAIHIRYDLRRFRHPSDGSLIVVSHTGIRLLAFALAHLFESIEEIRLPAGVESALQAIVPATGACTVVLDIDHEVREARMRERVRRGTVDYFDRYMGLDPERSERIERFLVWLGVTHLGAVRIENNNLSDAELVACLQQSMEEGSSTRSYPMYSFSG